MDRADVVEVIRAAAMERRRKGWRVFSASMSLDGARRLESSREAPQGLVEDDLSAVIQTLEGKGWKLEQVTPLAFQDGSSGPRFRALVVFRGLV